jgi:thiol-disulfide isomerase/thioredoxin
MTPLILFLSLVAVTILVWKLWKPIVEPPKQDVPKNEARLYFFYTDWCGFSKKAQPEWSALETTLRDGGYFGKTHVTPVKVDAEKEQRLATLYGVDAYPMAILETRDGTYEFGKRFTRDNLLSFLRERLGQEPKGL